MNRIYFGDNLSILRELPDESVDLIYIDPPFNTNKIQKRTTIKTVRDANGDRRGFKGNRYKTLEVGTKSYRDTFDSYIEGFLRPRMEEAYRLLKPHGSLYFHIDYREAHYCKIMLDEIFGRECFLNEIIWAYDYGGRARSRWPAKHDTIFYYVKDPQNYIFNTSEIDREPYMAPGLVGPKKAKAGKLPTDTWFFPYVGKRNTDTWWQTIVPTSGSERTGYPTQKPRKLLDRIIKASSHRGNLVLDFFAGSGTVGEACLELGRRFILIDDNPAALEVMARRFSNVPSIEWINFDPRPFQKDSKASDRTVSSLPEKHPQPSAEFQALAASISHLQKDLEKINDLWKGSPFEWLLQLSPRKKAKLGRQMTTRWLVRNGVSFDLGGDSNEALRIKGWRIAVKFSVVDKKGIYRFQQIRADDCDYALCLGISPFEAHCWLFSREDILRHGARRRKTEYGLLINPKVPPAWAQKCGGTLESAVRLIKNLKPKRLL